MPKAPPVDPGLHQRILALPAQQRRKALELLKERERWAQQNRVLLMFPDDGPLRRELYPKHTQFFAYGATYRLRCFMAGNRVGKTEAALTEAVYHLTGDYPHWWVGKRFARSIRGWLVGETAKLVREGIQEKLLGPWGEFGTGLLPAANIGKWTPKQGVAESVDTLTIKHRAGGWSRVELKSYDQGVESFASVERELILLDEEPPENILNECVMRTMTTGGIVMLPFTPLKGVTRVVHKFFTNGKPVEGPVSDGAGVPVTRALVMAGWDHAPHLDEKAIAELSAQYKDKPHELKARKHGIPELGSGLVFPVPEDSITVQPFEIPQHWVRIAGMDFGWDHPMGAVELAWDRDKDVIYVIKDFGEREMTPLNASHSLKMWGTWLPWAWPHDGKQSGGKFDAKDQRTLRDIYHGHGMDMLTEHATFPDGGNGVEAGIMDMLERMQTGRWKVFSSCIKWLAEFRTYHREGGLIVKLDDDVISASRYAYMMRRYARLKPRGAGKLRIHKDWRTA
jgi:phage terminase large subunit-like protein